MNSVALHDRARAMVRVLLHDLACVHQRVVGPRAQTAHVTGRRSAPFRRRRSPSSALIRS